MKASAEKAHINFPGKPIFFSLLLSFHTPTSQQFYLQNKKTSKQKNVLCTILKFVYIDFDGIKFDTLTISIALNRNEA